MESSMLKHFRAIGDIRSTIAGAQNLTDALERCVRIIRSVSGAESAVVWYYDKNGDRMLHPMYSLGSNAQFCAISAEEGAAAEVFKEQKPLLIFDYLQAQEKVSLPFVDPDTVKSLMCVPLYNKHESLGCITFVNKADGGLFTQDDADLCSIMSMLAAIEIDERCLEPIDAEKKEVLISLRGITRSFKNGDTVTTVLRGVDLDVYEGELLVILGESGCGKSTMLNIIGGMDQADGGSFCFRGQDYSRADDKLLTQYRRDFIGFIFQSYHLMPNLTAKQNLQFIAELKKDSGDPDQMLELVGLGDRKDNYPSQMSGGQQQRVSIARALVKKPSLILADEPTAALDYTTSIEVLSVIEQVAAQGTSILMVTHNEEITKMANRVIRMRGGKIDEIIVNRHPVKASELVW